MYVLFPVASRTLTELQRRYADKGGTNAVVVKLRLPDGSLYDQNGKIDYVEPTVSATTDTILLRARIANPPRSQTDTGEAVERALVDGAFVTVLVEGIQPVMALGIPRKAYCPISRAITSTSSGPTTGSSNVVFSWDSPRRPLPWSLAA